MSGKFTERQKIIHNIVRDMFDRAKELSKAGITYKEVHLEVCKLLAENMRLRLEVLMARNQAKCLA